MFKPRLCLLSLLLFAAACAAGERLTPGLQSTPATHLLPFPSHETADLTEYVLAGKDAESRSSGALELGSALELNATGGDFQFAVFRFNPATESPDSVSVLLEESGTTGAWIGLA